MRVWLTATASDVADVENAALVVCTIGAVVEPVCRMVRVGGIRPLNRTRARRPCRRRRYLSRKGSRERTRMTPPFQKVKAVGLCTYANVMALSAMPSRFSSGRMTRRSSIVVGLPLGCLPRSHPQAALRVNIHWTGSRFPEMPDANRFAAGPFPTLGLYALAAGHECERLFFCLGHSLF